jgi:hypothetical protein
MANQIISASNEQLPWAVYHDVAQAIDFYTVVDYAHAAVCCFYGIEQITIRYHRKMGSAAIFTGDDIQIDPIFYTRFDEAVKLGSIEGLMCVLMDIVPLVVHETRHWYQLNHLSEVPQWLEEFCKEEPRDICKYADQAIEIDANTAQLCMRVTPSGLDWYQLGMCIMLSIDTAKANDEAAQQSATAQ